jgi:hypothetical protein
VDPLVDLTQDPLERFIIGLLLKQRRPCDGSIQSVVIPSFRRSASNPRHGGILLPAQFLANND